MSSNFIDRNTSRESNFLEDRFFDVDFGKFLMDLVVTKGT